MPATWTDQVNRRPGSPAPEHSVSDPLVLKAVEAKYQLSLKTKFAHSLFGTPVSLWGGYTQSSRWQLYNGADSRPFRETNYEPEVMLVAPLDSRHARLEAAHGLAVAEPPVQRPRAAAVAQLEPPDRRPGLRARRLGGRAAALEAHRANRPTTTTTPTSPTTSDASICAWRATGASMRCRVQLRHSLRGGNRSRGSAQIDYVFPLAGALHGQLQLFSGYGESLIDYNLRQTKAGLGVTIAGWR